MDWQHVIVMGQKKATLSIKQGQPFRIVLASERMVTIDVNSGNRYIITRAARKN